VPALPIPWRFDFDSDPDIDLDPPDTMFIRGVDLMSAMTV